MKKDVAGLFRRGLDQCFAEALLTGVFRPLMDSVRDSRLDLEIRENYVNIYCGRNSILKLQFHKKKQRFSAIVHRKYNPPSGFVLPRSGPYAKQLFTLAEAETWTEKFVQSVPQLCLDSAPHNKLEGGAEFGIIQANHEPPFLVLDRQVQLEGAQDSKVDILGLSVEKDYASAVLIELKQGKHLNSPAVLNQIDRYRDYYAPHGRLRPTVADCLDEIFSLKCKLGLLSGSPPGPLRELTVDFLVVLVTANAPVHLPPPSTASGNLVYYVGLTTDELRIPERRYWKVLRSP